MLLAQIGDLPRHRKQAIDQAQLLALVAAGQRVVQFVGMIEVILDGRLAAACDKYELLDPRRLGLLDRVLDQRLVDHRQHLFRHGLGGRQETGAEAADRKYGLANRFDRHAGSVRCEERLCAIGYPP